MPPRPHGWRVVQPDDEGVCERRQRGRGPYDDRPSVRMRGFAWTLYALALLAAVCIFVKAL